MFGTVIKFSLLELSVFVDSEGTFKYGNISESIWETTGPATCPPWWLLWGGLYSVSNNTTWVSSTGEIATYDAT